jgi:isoamylase
MSAGFTQASRSRRSIRAGTYLGVIEKIPYLKSLGVTAVELMPVHEFPIRGIHGKAERPNYWGYDPMAFFAPHRGYAVGQARGAGQRVQDDGQGAARRGHRGDPRRGLQPHLRRERERGRSVVQGAGEPGLLHPQRRRQHYSNYSGCGNTINGNHPVVREMIFHCLRHWVHNYHIDGFRFDLASILSRDRYGNLVPNPPMVEVIAEDPMLADTKIIAEAWDAAGAYQVGSFGNSALGRMERSLSR